MRWVQTYTPRGGEAPGDLVELAYRCGRDLHPEDGRAAWIDDAPVDVRGDLIAAYHQGQAEQYEGEAW